MGGADAPRSSGRRSLFPSVVCSTLVTLTSLSCPLPSFALIDDQPSFRASDFFLIK